MESPFFRENIERLDPQAADAQSGIESYARDLHGHTRELETLRRQDAPEQLVARIEQMLRSWSALLKELTGSIENEPTAVVRGRVFQAGEDVPPCQGYIGVIGRPLSRKVQIVRMGMPKTCLQGRIPARCVRALLVTGRSFSWNAGRE